MHRRLTEKQLFVKCKPLCVTGVVYVIKSSDSWRTDRRSSVIIPLRVPEPARHLLHSQGGPTAAAVIAAAFALQLVEIGLWRLAAIAAVAILAFSSELWMSNMRMERARDDALDRERQARAALLEVEDAASDRTTLAEENELLKAQLAELRTQAQTRSLTLHRLLGELGNQARIIETIERQRLFSLGVAELLVVRLQLAGDSVIVAAHAPYDEADGWDSEPVTLLDERGQITGNGVVISTSENQVVATFSSADVPDRIQEALLRDGAAEPEGFRLVPWGVTLTPYLSLDDERLEALRDALEVCADAIALTFTAPAEESTPEEEASQEEPS